MGAKSPERLFNRMYQTLRDETLADVARFWLERTPDMREPGAGVAGFTMPPDSPDPGDGSRF